MQSSSEQCKSAIADNTLLDNNRVAADLKRYFIAEVGEARAHQYWEIFEELRNVLSLTSKRGVLNTSRDRAGARRT